MYPARNWREYNHRYRLEGSQCKKCGLILFPHRLICPKCKAREFEVIQLPHEGKIISFTTQTTVPHGFEDEAPISLGIVELTNGLRLTTQIADCHPDKIKIGMPVKREFRKIREDGHSGINAYGYKFVPVR
ncbi:MAG: Zn-ribbon domain-containing OB-fold protein [Deltaproteobacteria bacterium]|nr:Zn-ribbon domain-containing OB-fold protein [Deltaproteobacteria bacterium]